MCTDPAIASVYPVVLIHTSGGTHVPARGLLQYPSIVYGTLCNVPYAAISSGSDGPAIGGCRTGTTLTRRIINDVTIASCLSSTVSDVSGICIFNIVDHYRVIIRTIV